MIIAAVDNSYSTSNYQYAERYRNTVYKVLSSLDPPIRVIYWNNKIEKDIIFSEDITEDVSNFKSTGGTKPRCLMKYLPIDIPIELYIFTDGEIFESDIRNCHSVLKKKNVVFSKVHLYYIGIKSEMNLGLTDLFTDIPKTLQINDQYVGSVESTLIKFEDISYDYIMKDDSFKATILFKINSPDVNKAELKRQLNLLTYRILKERFEEKWNIQKFYTQQDVEGCIEYVKNISYPQEKVDFQRKMSEILNLFGENINTYDINLFKKTKNHTLTCNSENDDEDNLEEEQEEKKQNLDSKLLTCDILLQHCNLACIPLKLCEDNIWPDKKIIRNPFKLLESDALIDRIVKKVEPYIMDYKNAYKQLKNPNISPFSRDVLQGVYLLHNDGIDMEDMIKHNNYVLSTLFQNRLPGKPVLWHMIFLYIMALKRFPEKKNVFFEEIRFLGQYETYFITLVPYLDPPVIENLNCCFWYIANVCHKAFPNNRSNILRKPDFISGVFLEFYKNVYQKDYVYPLKLPEWQLWHTLHRNKTNIFRILSHYFHHEQVSGLETEFQIILYNERKQLDSQVPKEFKFLSQFSLEQILDIYAKKIKAKTYFADWESIETESISLYDEEESKNNYSKRDLLFHVKINPKTCHPHIICPITGKYWKDCIGEYDIKKRSYVRLFKRFCENYQKYPKNRDELLCFLNKSVFNRKNCIPELFDLNVKNEMDGVLKIFKPIMNMYTCREYLRISNKNCNEQKRKKIEEAMPELKELMQTVQQIKIY